jgi:hypothetical protein
MVIVRLVRTVEMSFGSAKKIRENPKIDTIKMTNRSQGASETLNHINGDLKALQRCRFPTSRLITGRGLHFAQAIDTRIDEGFLCKIHISTLTGQ